jgi:hypothetical protein
VRTTTEELDRPCRWGKLAGFLYRAQQGAEASMVFRVVLFVWEFLMDVLVVSRLSDEEKELEVLLLRQ